MLDLAPSPAPELLAVGHGPLDRAGLAALLRGASVEAVVDVRRFPASRTNPDARREALQEWLPGADIAYRWEERLGGRRHSSRDAVEPDTWWTVPAFRAYAAHTRSPQFRDALDGVLATARRKRLAVMCSERVWWRCHRRLIADVAVLGHGIAVQHLLPSGKLQPHPVAAGARVGAGGLVVWDGDA